jgi:hypothetical protein
MFDLPERTEDLVKKEKENFELCSWLLWNRKALNDQSKKCQNIIVNDNCPECSVLF